MFVGKERERYILRVPTMADVTITLLEYFWALLVVLNGNSVYHANALKDYGLLELCVFMTGLLVVAESFLRRLKMYQGMVVLSVVMAIYNVIYMCVRSTTIAVVDFACLFVIGFPLLLLLFKLLQSEGLLLQLITKLYDVVFVLALISLYYWVFGVVMEVFRPNMYTVISWGTFGYIPGYDGLHFAFQLDTTFFPDAFIFRNSGIFAEAPMFNLWLDMALAGELFLKPKPSWLRVAVLMVTIITTLSVTGMIFIVLCVMIHVLRKFRKMTRFQRNMVLFSMFLLLPMMAIGLIYIMVIKSGTQSYEMRLSDYVAGFKVWMDHPIFGSGYANLRSLMEYMYSPDGVIGFSNSLMAVLGTGGLWIAILFYIPHFSTLSPRVTGNKGISSFSLCYLYLFCTTAYFGRYIVVVMAAFAIAVMRVGPGKKER